MLMLIPALAAVDLESPHQANQVNQATGTNLKPMHTAILPVKMTRII